MSAHIKNRLRTHFPNQTGKPMLRYFITGATGFIGGYLAETLVAQGQQVCTVARPHSDSTRLEALGVAIHRGDLADAALLRQLATDADVVIHCAARLGDWGPVEDYRPVNVEGLRHLLEACKGQTLSRFLHMSSLGVYALRHHYGTDESQSPPARHRDGYTQSKVEAEALVMRYYRDYGIPAVILRPGFVYGPRDRTVLPNIIEGLRRGTIRYPGGGRGALNTIYVGNLEQAVLLAIETPDAVGQVYNLTDGEIVSKRQFIEAVANAFGLPAPTRTPPLWLARLVTDACETFGRLTGARQAPLFTRTKLKFLGYNLDFSIDKARRELGYHPRFSFEDAIEQTMKWYKEQESGLRSQGSGVRSQGSEVRSQGSEVRNQGSEVRSRRT
jgi:nucleoside-diphosphate-sugar epimerase